MGFNDHNINLERSPSSMKEAYSKIFSWILKPSAIKSEEAGLINKETEFSWSQFIITRTTFSVLILHFTLSKIKFTLANEPAFVFWLQKYF